VSGQVETLLRIERVWDRDARYVMLTRYTWDDDHKQVEKAEVLTENGWYQYAEGEMLPMDRIPKVDGRAIWRMRREEQLVEKAEKLLAEALGATADGLHEDRMPSWPK
jgi:hypothetical protein